MINTLRTLQIVPDTAADGPGIRTSIYLAGCAHQCPGCHNPQSWDFKGGEDKTFDSIIAEIKSYGHKKLTLTGGDPLYQAKNLSTFIDKLKEEIPDINIWLYTGYSLPELVADKEKYRDELAVILKVDTVVDGRFILKLRDTNLLFKGSSNQNIVNIKDWLEGKSVYGPVNLD